jgi:hypothetical protein
VFVFLQYGPCRVGTLPYCATTKRLAWNTDDVGMAAALSALPGVGAVSVTFSRTSDFKTAAWAVSFLTACDALPIVVADSSVRSLAVATVAQGACAYVGATHGAFMEFPYVNDYLIGEKQVRTDSRPHREGEPFV